MNSDYSIEFDKSGIIIVDNLNKSVTLDKLIMFANLYGKSTNKTYNYGVLKRIPGYWFSYNLKDKSVIVCGTNNKKDCVNETKRSIKT